jgi:hypothetical protein
MAITKDSRMTLTEFSREIGNRLSNFADATRAAQEEGEDGFVGPRFERRTFSGWMAEFDAYETLRSIHSQDTPIFDRRKAHRRTAMAIKVGVR